jgi:Zn-dependent protease
MDPILGIIIYIVILLFSVVFHEVAHGLVAERLGDPTARFSGRLTLNPVPHIDPVGSILLPAILYFLGLPMLGAAKPVPVDYRNIRNFKLGLILVSIAGPITNFILAILAALVYRYAPNLSDIGEVLLLITVRVNLILGVFNLIPIPPLDGSKVLAGVIGYLDRNAMHWFLELERFGFLIILFLLMIPNVLSSVLIPPAESLWYLFLGPGAPPFF